MSQREHDGRAARPFAAARPIAASRLLARSRLLTAGRLLAAGALIAIGLLAPSSSGAALAQAGAAPFCEAGRTPTFLLGLATLKERVGDPMGDPTECEHTNPENGDLLQRTTTGLAYYRPRLNMPAFTTGAETWALSPRGRGLILWTGGSIEPPQPTPEEDVFFRAWMPILDRELEVYDAVGSLDTTLLAGRSDTVDPADVRAALVKMRGVQADFWALRTPPRLVRPHGLWLERIDSFGDYLELALQALESADPAERDALLVQADRELDRGIQAGRDANTAFDAVLPVEIDQLRQAGFPGGLPR